MFGNEIAFHRGEATLATLYDMEKFYDNISIPALIKEATRLGYPAWVLKLVLQMHMARRSIRCCQFHLVVTVSHNGIIAGCTQSTTVAKILLHAICQQAYDVEIAEAMARRYPQGYAATLGHLWMASAASVGARRVWVLQAQRTTSSMLLKGPKENKCKT
eukprot:3418420-Karenia_brevis.AAC.1